MLTAEQKVVMSQHDSVSLDFMFWAHCPWGADSKFPKREG